MSACTHTCRQGRDCTFTPLITQAGSAQIDTELPTPTAPIERIDDGLQQLGYFVFVALLVFAAALMGIALPYFLTF